MIIDSDGVTIEKPDPVITAFMNISTDLEDVQPEFVQKMIKEYSPNQNAITDINTKIYII